MEIEKKKCQDCQFSSGKQGKDIVCSYVSGKLIHFALKYIIQYFFSLRFVLNLFLIFNKFQARVLIKSFLYRKSTFYDFCTLLVT